MVDKFGTDLVVDSTAVVVDTGVDRDIDFGVDMG